MLTSEQLEYLRDKASKITDPVLEFLLRDIARRVSQAGQLTSTESYQIWRAQQLGMSQSEVKKKLANLLKKSSAEIEQLLRQSADVGYDFDIRNFKTVDAVPLSENTALQKIVQGTVDMVGEEFRNLTKTLGMVDPFGHTVGLTEIYRQCCDEAFRLVNTGATDYTTAIRRATRNLSEHGIRTIDYVSGVHRSIEAAVRGSVMGGMGLMQEQISQQTHDMYGCDGWEISAHAASAPDHEPIQGRQYSDADYKALNNSLVRRIGTLNCGHVAFPIRLGIDTPQHTNAELERLRAENEAGVDVDGKHYSKYEATQMQRKLERLVRKQKNRILVDEAADDEDKLLSDQIRLQRYRQEYSRFSKAADLRTQNERAQVAGFGRKQAAEATKAAQQAHKDWLRSIGAENTELNTLAKYHESRYNNSQEYQLLNGYRTAVQKGDISPLVGFDTYKHTYTDILNSVLGQKTSTGIEIKSLTTHFVDRVIGQVSDAHPNMRQGVPIADALAALQEPVKLGEVRELPDGDIRQTFFGNYATVTISIRDSRLIQTNPRKGK